MHRPVSRPPFLRPIALVALTLTVLLTMAACAQDAAGREAAGRAPAAGATAAGAPAARGTDSAAPASGATAVRETAGAATVAKETSAGGATTPSQGAADGGVEAKASSPAPTPILAEAKDPDAPVIVQVVDARRATADTVRIRLAFVSKAAEPQTVPLFGEGTNPADFCLLTADGSRRLFVLRDAQNQPVLDGSLQPLRHGERRVLDAMFPAPPAQTDRVTLRLGKLTLRNIPIAR